MVSIGIFQKNNIEDRQTATDCQALRQSAAARGIVFYAHPFLHGLPWSDQDSIAYKHVLMALKKQPFRWCKGAGSALTQTVLKLEQAARRSPWQAGALSQTPYYLWAHGKETTGYKVWVCYRVGVRQLNTYFPGRQQDPSCRKLQCCQG
uniref:Uncharacterized protein n=1 Tax=Peronospora matthiolae TaxID=2874970 RepID=A0AAV1TSU2_9STRA